ncbi:hypothetical protein [Lentilitoribacter sp. EG35]|uniref:hypothetical protein n=1 Tax=Lentilitoribacter sp. EG35 TaxID=3234192 RepID=UPI0034607458
MQKHSNFWIGFFIAFLLLVPILLGAWGIAQEHAKAMITFALGALFSAILILVLILFFRDRILEKIFGSTKSSIEDVSQEALLALTAATTGKKDEAIKHTSSLVGAGAAWYMWAGFYRWVIGTCVALLVGFGAFTGTVLLFEQNKKLDAQTEQLIAQNKQFEAQNALASVSMVSGLRERLRSVGTRSNTDIGIAPDVFLECGVDFDYSHKLSLPANPSEVAAVKLLAQDENLSDNVIQSLTLLLRDESSAVKFAALSILDELEQIPEQTEVYIADLRLVYDNNSIIDYTLQSDVNIWFARSLVAGFKCENCLVDLDDSVFQGHVDKIDQVSHSLYTPVSSLTNEASALPETHFSSVVASIGQASHQLMTTSKNISRVSEGPLSFYFLSNFSDNPHCKTLETLSRQNPFLLKVKETETQPEEAKILPE